MTAPKPYPVSTVLFILAYNLSIWALGTLIFWFLMPVLGLLYPAMVLLITLWIIWARCRHCVYYGKLCGSGLGVVAGFLFKPGDKALFKQRFHLSWPNLLIWILPPVVGLGLLFFRGMDWWVAGATGAFVVLAWFHRSISLRMVCSTCAQKNICPMVNPPKEDR